MSDEKDELLFKNCRKILKNGDLKKFLDKEVLEKEVSDGKTVLNFLELAESKGSLVQQSGRDSIIRSNKIIVFFESSFQKFFDFLQSTIKFAIRHLVALILAMMILTGLSLNIKYDFTESILKFIREVWHPVPPIQATIDNNYGSLLLDNFERNDWSVEINNDGPSGAKAALSVVQGISDKSKGLRIDYELNSNSKWILLSNESIQIPKNVEEGELSFYIFGSSKPVCDFEIKFVKANPQITLGSRFTSLSETSGEWRKIVVPYSSLKFFFNNFKKEKTDHFEFAITSFAGEGKGFIILDNFEFSYKKK